MSIYPNNKKMPAKEEKQKSLHYFIRI